MKKGKVILSAIAVFAILAGAFAFKAKTFSFETLYIPNSNPNNCDFATTIYTRIAGGSNLKASTATGTNNCSTLKVTTVEQ
jgi:hypothetical protein